MIRPGIAAAVQSLIRRLDDDASVASDTVATGFPTLDRMLGGGVRRGDLVVLAGDTSSGKSALALAFALRASEAGHVTHLLSGELSPERVLERAVAIEGRVSVDELRRGGLDDERRAAAAAAALALRDRAPDVDALPAGDLDAAADLLRRALDLELAVVDPLPALARGAAPLAEEMADVVRRLKALALELDAAVLVTTPLAGPVRDRTDQRPTLDDLGALGTLRQHADVVLGLYREELYQADRGIEGAAELHLLKSRNGPTGYVDLYFYRSWLRFEDMVDPDR
ncbi:MAG TPA: DnaB-like helicase C-terminal domain-containing protein [Gemmatimonadales bacterium]